MDYSVGGVYLLGEVTFLPKAGYSGVVTIPYVGTRCPTAFELYRPPFR